MANDGLRQADRAGLLVCWFADLLARTAHLDEQRRFGKIHFGSASVESNSDLVEIFQVLFKARGDINIPVLSKIPAPQIMQGKGDRLDRLDRLERLPFTRN